MKATLGAVPAPALGNGGRDGDGVGEPVTTLPSPPRSRRLDSPRPARHQARPGGDRRRLRAARPARAARSVGARRRARTGRARRRRRSRRSRRRPGCRTGLYTSPHLIDVTERIRLGGGRRRRRRSSTRRSREVFAAADRGARGAADLLRGDDGGGVRRLCAPRARAGDARGRPRRPARRDQRRAGDPLGRDLDRARPHGGARRRRSPRSRARRPASSARGRPALVASRLPEALAAFARGGASASGARCTDGRRDARSSAGEADLAGTRLRA